MQPAPARELRVLDITEEVEDGVRRSAVTMGLACIYSLHPDTIVRAHELESGLLEDFARLLERLGPDPAPEEDAESGRGRRRANLLAMLLGPAGELVPIAGGRLALGRWQRVLLIALGDEPEPAWELTVVGDR